MHLKQLKLAGFKSFVEPTVVSISKPLVAVVGPNGCGKSNLIDAVRWVMGESSAKTMRAGSMVDVIFNGSALRKPLGQASVELIFDNTMGRLSGAYSTFSEVSVKRVITRIGESFYYLNGTRCRRRDITALFHGTGSRVYSIIGQGNISQLIEAKPEDLRVYLEEAAGVSLYKERRSETMQRIESTESNLTRLYDIREELDKQLQRLERQARAAKRYQELKAQETTCKAEILALKWQDFKKEQAQKQQGINTLIVEFEKQEARLRQEELRRLKLHEQISEVQEAVQNNQLTLYQLGTEIHRLEEDIDRQAREKKRLEEGKAEAQREWGILKQSIEKNQEALEAAGRNAQIFEKAFKELELELEQKQESQQEALHLYEAEEGLWLTKLNELNGLKSELQIAKVNRQHTEIKLQEIQKRIQKLQNEWEALSISVLEDKLNALEVKTQSYQDALLVREKESKEQSTRIEVLRAQLKASNEALERLEDEYLQINSEYKALEATQASLKGIDQQVLLEKPRLIEFVQIDAQWQLACDSILDTILLAYVIDDSGALRHFDRARHFVTLREPQASASPLPRLVDKMRGLIPASMVYLESIYIADNLDEAFTRLTDILPYESIVTPDGIWLGQGWIQYPKQEDQNLGLLSRQQKIEDLARCVQTLKESRDLLVKTRHEKQQALHSQETVREGLQLQLKECTKNLQSSQLELNQAKQSLLQSLQWIKQSEKDLVELQQQADETQAILQNIQRQEAALAGQEKIFSEQQALFLKEKAIKQAALAALQQSLSETNEQRHQQALTFERELHKIEQMKEKMRRETEALQGLEDKIEQLAIIKLEMGEPALKLQEKRANLLEQHTKADFQKTTLATQCSQFNTEQSQLDIGIRSLEKELNTLQEKLADLKLQEQVLQLHVKNTSDSLEELNYRAENLLPNLQGISQNQREEALLLLIDKIKAQGAINWAAIEEFDLLRERKKYLDDQYEDLKQALYTLELAIKKMDAETLLRLENTFEAVNTSFKALFPRLFGGGRAQLELTCDNLLEAGIVVMAEPPGKRNASIHLLSGGEKAMTAVALVFAIFQLNPSPFCMLDEVDAPLDDVNIGRFCDLVKEMSPYVQFLFITHNKVTMELADDLIGVTMREPGVSRLVTVDVKQALTMR